MQNTVNNNNELKIVNSLKREVITIPHKNNIGHISSSLSCLEIMYVLYGKIANINIDNLKSKDRDRVLLSKEHCRIGHLIVLSHFGLIDKKDVESWVLNDSELGHDIFYEVNEKYPAIDISFGTLGMGIGLAAGMAWAKPNSHIYVIVGDGELQEGSMWEAIMFIGHHQIKNVTIIVDRNNLQISDYTKNIIDSSSNVIEQIKSFNFDCIECNGHDICDIEKAFKTQTKKPKCIVANTIKGKECMFVVDSQNTGYLHGSPFSEEEIKIMLSNIEE